MPEAREVTFEELPVGAALGPVDETLTPELVRRYAASLETANPWYRDRSPFGAAVVPVSLLEHLALLLWSLHYNLVIPGGRVHSRTETRLTRPALVGSRVRISGRVVDKYERRGKFYVVYDAQVVDQQGQELVTVRLTQAFLPDGSAVRAR